MSTSHTHAVCAHLPKIRTIQNRHLPFQFPRLQKGAEFVKAHGDSLSTEIISIGRILKFFKIEVFSGYYGENIVENQLILGNKKKTPID